jgi:hypothetical protein
LRGLLPDSGLAGGTDPTYVCPRHEQPQASGVRSLYQGANRAQSELRLFSRLRIPPTTGRSWISRGLGKVVSLDEHWEVESLLRGRISRLGRRARMLSAAKRLTLTLLTCSTRFGARSSMRVDDRRNRCRLPTDDSAAPPSPRVASCIDYEYEEVLGNDRCFIMDNPPLGALWVLSTSAIRVTMRSRKAKRRGVGTERR